MSLDKYDLGYLIDIINSIKDIKDFTKNIQYNQYENDRKTKLAVERSIEIIGEAAKSIRETTRNIYKNIDWDAMMKFRNKLVHEYGDIKTERTWKIAKKTIIELENELYKIDDLKKYLVKLDI